MNDREKKLLTLLVVAAFVIANIFVYNLYNKGKQRLTVVLANGKNEIEEKSDKLAKAKNRYDEWDWFIENQPADGIHGRIRAELATYAEQSASRYRVLMKKRPILQREDLSEGGIFRSAKVKVIANGRDAEIYRWLVDLQDPKKSRSITRLMIAPQRDDATRMDCELELAQWFSPVSEGSDVTSADTSN
jgi:hypothetical protein